MNYKQLLINIMSQRHLKPFKAAPLIGVSVIVLQSFLAGMPVKQPQEDKLVAYIEGVI